MNLLLELGIGSSAAVDVTVDVEPTHSVGELCDRLVDFARSRGLPVPEPYRLVHRGTALDDAVRVFDVGLAGGDRVELSASPPDDEGSPPAHDPTIRVMVTGGPDAGPVVLLGAGQHRIGRDPVAAVPVNDPILPREAAVVRVGDGGCTVEAGQLGVELDGEPLTAPTHVVDAGVLRVGDTVLELEVLEAPRRGGAGGTVAHNRTPYRRPRVQHRELPPVPRPPDEPTRPRFVVASALLPVVSGLMLVAVSGRPHFLALVLLSPLLPVWTHVQDRRSGRRRHRADRARFEQRIAQTASAVDSALADELTERRRAAPDLVTLRGHVEHRQRRLWERDRSADDFLDLRVGVSMSTPSQVTATVEAGGDERLREWGLAQLTHAERLVDAPVSVPMGAGAALSVHGAPDRVRAAVRALLVQAAALHSPEDLIIAALVPPAALAEFEWLKWLPHTRSSASPLRRHALACWPDETHDLLVELAAVADERAEDRRRRWPRVLVAIDDGAGPDRAVLSRLLEGGPDAGISVIWAGRDSDAVPRQVDHQLRRGRGDAPCILTGTETKGAEIVVDELDLVAARRLARAMAPLRDATSASQSASLPALVPLHDVLVTGRPDADRVLRCWRASVEGLPAPVGWGSDGGSDGPLVLDLVEDGPHALVAGTSGAGKSEFLQSLVASLAVSHPPDRLNFLFIDYKGGAFSGPFASLPHTVGAVTNLDERLSRRALTSLLAELDRRMLVLEGRAKDLTELEALDPDGAPPRLVIVVDEFATLVKEIPAFVAGMVDLAQRGRSLGIHLVLATQRPAGSVNDNILANTNLRVCLRVLDPGDSTSVIGAPDAAELPPPRRGRAYARTGPGELHPFQSAFAGADDGGPDLATGPIVASLPFSGASFASAAETTPTTGATQLESTVAAVMEAFGRTGSDLPVRPWVEPLPELVDLLQLDGAPSRSDAGRHLTLGLADHPSEQRQSPLVIDLEAAGGLLVVGASGSGRTTALRTAIADLARQGGGDAVEIHVVDGAGRGLSRLTKLPQVASVHTLDDLEPVARLVEVLESEVHRRRALLAEQAADSLSSLRRFACAPVAPRVVLVVDGLRALRDAFDTADTFEWFSRLQRIVTDGRQVGFHLVATAERRAGLPAAVVGALGARVVLRTSDPEEAVSLGVPRDVAAATAETAGRGWYAGAEIQVAVVGDDASGPGQVRAIDGLAHSLGSVPRARALPELSAGGAGEVCCDGLRVSIGEVDLQGGAAEVDLSEAGLLVTGPPGSGRSTVLASLADALDRGLVLVAVGGPQSPLATLGGFDEWCFRRGRHADVLERVATSVDPDGAPEVVVFVDSVEDVSGTDSDRALERLVAMSSVRLVASADPVTVSRAFSGWLSELRRRRSMLVLRPEDGAETEQVTGLRLRLRPGQPLPPGRGWLVRGRSARLVQTAVAPSLPHHMRIHEHA